MRTSSPKQENGNPRQTLLARARHAAALLLLLASPALDAAELLYVYAPDCGACRAFDRDIGEIYPKTEEARTAPLRRLNISDIPGKRIVLGAQRVQLNSEPIGTPTFILISEGHEIDRFSGYSSDELFWMSLQRLLNKLPQI
ncbi:thioredoxin family protein [uncultured Microbulbifer sp.]|uniref:thioredoxin family protein n=1 Tax=uncultured Microbulbifer sp. TaxID=348147 RepID=UPI0025E475E6|nr:thioredoxin family protein [uncultured Microbulbifer sp.]